MTFRLHILVYIIFCAICSARGAGSNTNTATQSPVFYQFGFEYQGMISQLTNLEHIRSRFDFLNFGLVSTVKIKKNLSIESKISLIKYGVVREAALPPDYLGKYYLNKQVIRSVQVPVMINIDLLGKNPSGKHINIFIFRGDSTIIFLLTPP